MVRRLDRIIFKAADPFNKTPVAYGVSELERMDDGTDRECPMRDIDLKELGAIAELFSLDAVKERDELKAKLAEKTKELDEQINKDKDDLRKVDEAHRKQMIATSDAANKTISELQKQLDSTHSRIAELTSYYPRIITAKAFEKRLSSEQMRRLGFSSDPTTQLIAKRLNEVIDAGETVRLDHPKFVGSVCYLLNSKQITQDEYNVLLRDGTRDECVPLPEVEVLKLRIAELESELSAMKKAKADAQETTLEDIS